MLLLNTITIDKLFCFVKKNKENLIEIIQKSAAKIHNFSSTKSEFLIQILRIRNLKLPFSNINLFN